MRNEKLEFFIQNFLENSSPLIKQYVSFKQEYLTYLLFFRVGDFYELLFDDADLASRELGLFLTNKKTKQCNIPMCGVPFHAIDNYISKLVKEGYKIVICDQVANNDEANLDFEFSNESIIQAVLLEDLNSKINNNIQDQTAQDQDSNSNGDSFNFEENQLDCSIKTKKLSKIKQNLDKNSKKKNAIMERVITKVITKGTLTIDSLINSSILNYLVSIYKEKNLFYITCIDVGIGEVNVIITDNILNEILTLNPKEILILQKNKDILEKDKDLVQIFNEHNSKISFIKEDVSVLIDDIINFYSQHINTTQHKIEDNCNLKFNLNNDFVNNYNTNANINTKSTPSNSYDDNCINTNDFSVKASKIATKSMLNYHTLSENSNLNSQQINSLSFKQEDLNFKQDDLNFKQDDLLNIIFKNCYINLKNFSIQSVKVALGMCINYIKKIKDINFLNLPSIVDKTSSFVLDSISSQHLEIFENIRGETKNSLFDYINNTVTKQGSRLMQKFLMYPLKNIEMIIKRQVYIEIFKSEVNQKQDFLNKINIYLSNVLDFERILAKLSSYEKPMQIKNKNKLINDTNKKNIIQSIINMQFSMIFYNKIEEEVLKIKQNHLRGNYYEQIKDIANVYIDFSEIYESGTIFKVLIDEINAVINAKDLCISINSHPRLQILKNDQLDNEFAIKDLESKYKEQTKIDNLKIVYNNLFGYCIEVSAKFLDKISNLTNNIGFINKHNSGIISKFKTKEIIELEKKIIFNMIEMHNLEQDILHKLIIKILSYSDLIIKISNAIAYIDAFLSFTKLAINNNYKRPILNYSQEIIIKDNKHPILDNIINFTSNDVSINEHIIVITGPNMGGKSTYLRQIALSVLLAQIGSFIPCSYALIGIIDQIFTRIGSSDNITKGESTFMKEMTEVSSILQFATQKSLIILDEVGRGTSTFDGMAISFAIIEYIFLHIKARCIFATHYHELLEIKKMINSKIKISSYFAAIDIKDNNITYLYKILPGFSSNSYGIYVAKEAKLPSLVIQNAMNYLQIIKK